MYYINRILKIQMFKIGISAIIFDAGSFNNIYVVSNNVLKN